MWKNRILIFSTTEKDAQKQEAIWSQENQLKLLSAMVECGFGNWKDISKRVPPFTPDECELHYIQEFIKSPKTEELRAIAQKHLELAKQANGCCAKCKLPGYVQQVLDHMRREESGPSQDPLEHSLKGVRPIKSQGFCSGFNPCRADFDVEYDEKAENLLVMLGDPIGAEPLTFDSPEDKHIHAILQSAVVQAYNFRLAERVRRKRIIRDHALLDRRRLFHVIQMYKSTIGKSNCQALMRLMQIMPGPELDLLLERMKLQTEIQFKIQKLLSYRKEGIKSLAMIKVYESQCKQRIKFKRELEATASVISLEGVQTSRRPSQPLVLYNLPGYSHLDDDEKDLCSNARLVPQTYLEFKKLLIQECAKHDGLRLAKARVLLKIDVNKTRKVFDFLQKKGKIWLPSSDTK